MKLSCRIFSLSRIYIYISKKKRKWLDGSTPVHVCEWRGLIALSASPETLERFATMNNIFTILEEFIINRGMNPWHFKHSEQTFFQRSLFAKFIIPGGIGMGEVKKGRGYLRFFLIISLSPIGKMK